MKQDMKHDILIAGVGGQGILTIAAILGRTALDCDLNLKQSEVHGMAQRGGCVQSHMRISSGTIFSDVIPYGKADMVIAMEPMEALRYLPYLSPEGWIIANQEPVINIKGYPEVEEVVARIRSEASCLVFNALEVASGAGSRRSVNVALLGAASCFTGLPSESFERGIKAQFSRKGEAVVETNLKVFRAARKLGEERRAS